MKDAVQRTFAARYGRRPTLIARAPGRVNLVGEHTDYNEGFVLPAAIDRALWIAAAPRDDRRACLYSLDQGGAVETVENVENVENVKDADGDGSRQSRRSHLDGRPPWSRYAGGAWNVLARAGRTAPGADLVIGSEVPMGAGLASSAALGVALVETLIALGGGEATLLEKARLAQVLEHRFLGVPCGLMDQLAAAGGRDGAALFIDCRAPSVRSVPMPSEVRIAVLDAMKPRRLAESAFARRRAECEEAARILGVPALRDASMDLVAGIRARLGETLFRRARHVVTENERVMAAVAALERHARARDACEQQALEGALEQRPLEQRPGEQRPLARRALEEIGSLLDASHASLRDDYAVSVPELDTITEIARAHPACYGSRLMGAGFGGSAIALIRAEAVEAFTAHVVEAYATATNLRPDVYICRPSAGSSVEWLDA